MAAWVSHPMMGTRKGRCVCWQRKTRQMPRRWLQPRAAAWLCLYSWLTLLLPERRRKGGSQHPLPRLRLPRIRLKEEPPPLSNARIGSQRRAARRRGARRCRRRRRLSSRATLCRHLAEELLFCLYSSPLLPTLWWRLL